MRILIAGAGISGLTAALSLHAVGFKPIVFEAVAKPAPLGVGINILPHAMREFTELGLLQDLKRLGVEIEELLYLTRYGREIWREPRGPPPDTLGRRSPFTGANCRCSCSKRC